MPVLSLPQASGMHLNLRYFRLLSHVFLRTRTLGFLVFFSCANMTCLFPAGPGKEWVAIIEALYVSPEDGKPCFKGRWYWTLSEVQEHWRGGGEKARASKNSKHELISSDKRDSNPVEVINRKATILSWKNFRDLYKRNRARCEGVYYTDRMYYHKGLSPTANTTFLSWRTWRRQIDVFSIDSFLTPYLFYPCACSYLSCAHLLFFK